MRIIVPSDCWYPQLIEPQTPCKSPSSRSRLALLLSPAQDPVLLRIARARPSPFKLGQPDAGHGYKIKSKAQNQQLFSQRTPLPDARMHGVQRSFTRQQVRRRRSRAACVFTRPGLVLQFFIPPNAFVFAVWAATEHITEQAFASWCVRAAQCPCQASPQHCTSALPAACAA
jgi:hypothetical protein